MPSIDVRPYREMLRRFLKQKGEEDLLQELDSQITSVLVLDSQENRVDWRYLLGEKLVCQTRLVSPTASLSTMRYRNPTDSKILATFTSFTIVPLAVQRLNIRISLTDVGNLATVIGAGVTRDTRWPLQPGALVVSESLVVAPVGVDIGYVSELTDRPIVGSIPPIVLAPGSALDIGNSALSSSDWFITAHWTERRASDFELS